jgi:hypothetical protein
MNDPRARRTLVKSPPELWAELSEPAALARHLDEFGEIRITRLEPERTVAWEGDHVRGTVRLEPGGWGTTVTLTAKLEQEEEPEPPPPPRPTLVQRLLRRQPEPEIPPDPPTPPGKLDHHRAAVILGEVLDDLGSAHHRPFSR